MSFDKKQYQRAYMKRKREKNLSGGVESRHADVIPTEQPVDRGEQNVGRGDRAGSVGVGISGSSAPPAQNNLPRENRRTRRSVDAVARPAASEGELATARPTSNKSGVWTPATEKSMSGQNFSYDKKKYPNRAAWEIAVQRVERAIRYADMFPHLIGSDDLKFQTLDWQYEHEGLKAPIS